MTLLLMRKCPWSGPGDSSYVTVEPPSAASVLFWRLSAKVQASRVTEMLWLALAPKPWAASQAEKPEVMA